MRAAWGGCCFLACNHDICATCAQLNPPARGTPAPAARHLWSTLICRHRPTPSSQSPAPSLRLQAQQRTFEGCWPAAGRKASSCVSARTTGPPTRPSEGRSAGALVQPVSPEAGSSPAWACETGRLSVGGARSGGSGASLQGTLCPCPAGCLLCLLLRTVSTGQPGPTAVRHLLHVHVVLPTWALNGPSVCRLLPCTSAEWFVLYKGSVARET